MGLKFVIIVVLSLQGWTVEAAMEGEPSKNNETMAHGHHIEFSSDSSNETHGQSHCYQCIYGLDGMMDKNCLHPMPSTVKNVSCESHVPCATVTQEDSNGLSLLIRSCGIGDREICGAIGSHTYEDLNLDRLFNNTSLPSTLQKMLQNLTKNNENGAVDCPEVCYCNGYMCNGKSFGNEAEASPHRDLRALSDDPPVLPAVGKNATGHPEDHHHEGATGGSGMLDISKALAGALIMTLGFIL